MTYFWENPLVANQRHDPDILEGLARGPYAIWWANRQEERGRSPSGDVYEAAPRTPARAKKWAREVADGIVALNGRSLSELYDVASRLGYGDDREHFGSDLGLQVTGEGVSWTDDLPSGTDYRAAESAIRLPRREFYL